MYYCLGEGDTALDRSRTSLEKWRKLGDKAGMALSLAWAGFLEQLQGQPGAGWTHRKKGVETALEVKDPRTIGIALYVGYTRPTSERTEALDREIVISALKDSIAELRKAGDLWGLGMALHGLGDILGFHQRVHEEQYEKARSCYLKALSLFHEPGEKWMIARTLKCMGDTLFLKGDIEESKKCPQQHAPHDPLPRNSPIQNGRCGRSRSGRNRNRPIFHLHAEFFDYYDHGTTLEPRHRVIDTIMQCQAQRGILEFSFRWPGKYMFHAHQAEFAELLFPMG